MPPVRKRSNKRRPKTSQEEKRTVRSSEHPPQTHSEKYGYKISHGPDQHNVEPAGHQAPHTAASYTMPEKSSVPEEMRRVRFPEHPAQLSSEEYQYNISYGQDQLAAHRDPYTAASYTVPEKSSVAKEMRKVRSPEHSTRVSSEEYGLDILYGPDQPNVEPAGHQAPHTAASYTVPEKSSVAEEMRRVHSPDHSTQLPSEEYGYDILYGPDQPNVEPAGHQAPHTAASYTVPEKSSVAEEMGRVCSPEHSTQLPSEEYGYHILYGPDKPNVEPAGHQDLHTVSYFTLPELSSSEEEEIRRRYFSPVPSTRVSSEEYGLDILYGPDQPNVEPTGHQAPHTAASYTVPEKSSVAEASGDLDTPQKHSKRRTTYRTELYLKKSSGRGGIYKVHKMRKPVEIPESAAESSTKISSSPLKPTHPPVSQKPLARPGKVHKMRKPVEIPESAAESSTKISSSPLKPTHPPVSQKPLARPGKVRKMRKSVEIPESAAESSTKISSSPLKPTHPPVSQKPLARPGVSKQCFRRYLFFPKLEEELEKATSQSKTRKKDDDSGET